MHVRFMLGSPHFLLWPRAGFMFVFDRLVDNVHPCATPCKRLSYIILQCLPVQHHRISRTLLRHFICVFIVLHIFPLTPISHSVFHTAFLHTVTWGFCTSRTKHYVCCPASFLLSIVFYKVYTWPMQLRFGLIPGCPSPFCLPLFSLLRFCHLDDYSMFSLRCSVALTLSRSSGQPYRLC